jgi:hypothetical protein
LAETSGTSGASGASGTSGYPIFKSEEGAFDRAKFNQQLNESQGKVVDSDAAEKMKAANTVIEAAKDFFYSSYEKNLKELSKDIDPKSIYYRSSSADTGSPSREIQKRIDKGEALDGKEIFDMSKKTAEQRIENANKLKNGKVTEIIESLGLGSIKDFSLYEEVKDDFDSKIKKNEKFKFEYLEGNLEKIISYFNEKDSTLASQYASKLYTDENRAILAAFAKILKGEGFDNDYVKKAAESYDKHMLVLSEKDQGVKAEDVIKKAGEEAKKEETATKTEEQKLEEKKAEEPKKEPAAENKDAKVDQPKETPTTTPTTEEPKKTEEKKEPEVKTAEQKLDEKKPEEKKESTGTVEGTKGKGKGKGKGKEKEPVFSEPVKGIFDMLGIKLPAAKDGEGDKGEGDKGKGKNKGLTTGSAQGDKTMEELGFAKPKEGESGGDKGKKDNKSTTDNKATKLDEKVSTNTDKKSETSTTSTPIKETQTQNLSSVSTPDTDKKDVKKEEPATTTATTTENQAVDKNTSAINDAKTTAEATKETEDKTKKEDQDKMNKEMSDNMKSMVSLLTQLNNTLKNPLMVIPNNKKFH